MKNLVGKKINKLTVKRLSDKPKSHNGYYWICECECGNETIVHTANLKPSGTKSCGCVKGLGRLKLGDESTFNTVLSDYKRKAAERGLTFELSNDEVRDFFSSNCRYCGLGPSNTYKPQRKQNIDEGTLVYNGIDRVDSYIGYTLNNCVPCCKVCNRAKSDMSIEEFYEWIYRISSRMPVA